MRLGLAFSRTCPSIPLKTNRPDGSRGLLCGPLPSSVNRRKHCLNSLDKSFGVSRGPVNDGGHEPRRAIRCSFAQIDDISFPRPSPCSPSTRESRQKRALGKRSLPLEGPSGLPLRLFEQARRIRGCIAGVEYANERVGRLASFAASL